MLEKDKAEKGQDMHSPDLHDGNYAKCKTPSSISAADMYCYCSQRLHKSSFPYVKILVPAIFFLKTRRSSKNSIRSNSKQTFYPESFPVARNFVIDRWNSELAYSHQLGIILKPTVFLVHLNGFYTHLNAITNENFPLNMALK